MNLPFGFREEYRMKIGFLTDYVIFDKRKHSKCDFANMV